MTLLMSVPEVAEPDSPDSDPDGSDDSGSEGASSSTDGGSHGSAAPPEGGGGPGPPSPSDSSSSASSLAEDDAIGALFRAVTCPLSPDEDADDRLAPGPIRELALAGRLSMNNLNGLMSRVLRSLSDGDPAPNRQGGGGGRPPPRSRRARRRAAYGRLQKMWSRNRTEACRVALEGTWDSPDERPSANDFINFWKPIFESPDLEEAPDFPNAVDHPILNHLEAPVAPAEVATALKGLGESASGPDRVSMGTIRSLPTAALARLFNAWLLVGGAPPAVSLSAVTFLPKVRGSRQAADYRPIAVGSHLTRCFHRLLARRLGELPISPYQVAFRPTDGCGLNVTLLESILSQARCQYKAVSMAFLDLRKAFDTASRKASVSALRKKGCPPVLLRYLDSIMSTAPLLVGGERIETSRGVRQGDPCSPVIFNVLIDTCLESLPEGIGWSWADHQVSAISYADDLILLANTPVGLQNLVDGAVRGFESGGLSLNPRKSATLSIRTSVRNSTWAVAPEAFFANGERLPMMGIESVYGYLGLTFSAAGSRSSFYEDFDRGLDRLRAAPLKPQQRLYALRVAFLPRFYHQVVLGKVRTGVLQRLDVRVRAFVRKALRLPNDLSLGAFYAPLRAGGMGLPLLSVAAGLWRRNRLEKIVAADEPAARVIASLGAYNTLLRQLESPIRFEGRTVTSKVGQERPS